MEIIDDYSIFMNKMMENEIKLASSKEQCEILKAFDNYLISKYKIFIHNKDGYQNYIRKSHEVFLIHFISDAQLVIFNRYLKIMSSKNINNKDLLNKICKVMNEKKNVSIPTEYLTEADIERINHDISTIEKLLERNIFDYKNIDKIKETIDSIRNGDYRGIANLKKAIDNFNVKAELDDAGLEEYIDIKLPYYLNLKTIDDKILDDVETYFAEKR